MPKQPMVLAHEQTSIRLSAYLSIHHPSCIVNARFHPLTFILAPITNPPRQCSLRHPPGSASRFQSYTSLTFIITEFGGISIPPPALSDRVRSSPLVLTLFCATLPSLYLPPPPYRPFQNLSKIARTFPVILGIEKQVANPTS